MKNVEAAKAGEGMVSGNKDCLRPAREVLGTAWCHTDSREVRAPVAPTLTG